MKKQVKQRKKRAMTLMEVMVVIFIIGLIAGVVGYNVKGSMDKGKQFKTDQAKKQLANVLELQLSESTISPEELTNEESLREILENSALVKDVNALMKDGYGYPFVVSLEDGNITVNINPMSPANKHKK